MSGGSRPTSYQDGFGEDNIREMLEREVKELSEDLSFPEERVKETARYLWDIRKEKRGEDYLQREGYVGKFIPINIRRQTKSFLEIYRDYDENYDGLPWDTAFEALIHLSEKRDSVILPLEINRQLPPILDERLDGEERKAKKQPA